MNVKQAVEVAKKYIQELFGEEEIGNLALEEIDAEKEGFWRITIGFSRPWNRRIGSILGGEQSRAYKVVLVRDSDGHVLSVRNRVFSEE